MKMKISEAILEKTIDDIRNMDCWLCVHCVGSVQNRPYCELEQDIIDPFEEECEESDFVLRMIK